MVLRKMRGAWDRVRLGWEILAVVRAKARSGGLPVYRQIGEMLWLKVSRRQTFRFYLMARMWRREMSWRDKRQHFNHIDFGRLVDTLNPPALRLPHGHKREQKLRLQQNGVPTPTWYGMFHPDHGTTASGQPLTNAAQLTALLRQHLDQRLVLKQVVGSGGEGFLSFFVHGDAGGQLWLQHPVTQQRISPAELVSLLQQGSAGYLIEQFLVQHPMLAKLNPDSANTLRIWVTNEGGDMRVPGLFLRIGRRHVMVDNTSAGGLLCTIDDATGELLELSSGDLWRQSMAAHPDTGVVLSGLKLPFFEDAKRVACTALACFPDMGIAGLDVAITEHGAQVIEINLGNPAQIGTAGFDKPGRDLFPKFFAGD